MSEMLKYLIEKRKKESFVDGYEATDEEALGVIIASYFDHTGIDILKTLSYALEDANFHSENSVIREMIEDLESPKPNWTVNFKSNRNGFIYTVKTKDNALTCDCLGYQYRRKCKHIKYVEDNIDNINMFSNPIEL